MPNKLGSLNELEEENPVVYYVFKGFLCYLVTKLLLVSALIKSSAVTSR